MGGLDQGGGGLDEGVAAAGDKGSLAVRGDRQWHLGRLPGRKKTLLPNQGSKQISVGARTPPTTSSARFLQAVSTGL